ncbi:hypothetical protein [Cytophaga sp. FL35]|uniref:hypothetical protein n=1 Tax=Cytophaga sp. FL35 TaxID=1904456 RepID=UPI0016534994|nr:hypothetical protein [Cytophaga sp. FL35]MBC6997102.1 hypothetical protein [Cytophaga sp. FL35]
MIDALEVFLIRFDDPFEEKKGITDRIKFQTEFCKSLKNELNQYTVLPRKLVYRRPAVKWLDTDLLFNCVSIHEGRELVLASDQKQIDNCMNLMQHMEMDIKVHLLIIEYLDFLVSLHNEGEVMYSTSNLTLKKRNEKIMI